MINRWKLIIFMQVSLYISINRGLTIRVAGAQDKNDESSSETTTTVASKPQTVYRHTVAKIKDTQYRVPEHLQFVPKGFVYEDADDVIHVIDPPKQFEELKRIMQREQQQQQQHQYNNNNNKQQRPFHLKPQRPKPKIFKATLPVGHFKEDHVKKSLNDKDLETQETQQLPVEILASVRKTEKYLKKFKPKLPLVKQRLKTKKIQTVIWENSQAEQQYQHGQEQRLQGIREQLPTSNQRRHYITKRFRREINTKNPDLKGEQLLQHINELIKNATFYLQLAEDLEDYKDRQTPQLATPTQTTIINPETTESPFTTTTLSEDMVVKILENSVKATNVIMQQIQTQTNLTDISEKCDHLKVTYPNHIQNLQNQIKCMQNFIEDINHPTEAAATLLNDEYLDLHKTKDLRHKPFLVAQLGDDYIDDTASTPVNTSLIYDDVMTTIRNMLLLQNLQSLEETSAASTSPTWEDTPLVYDKSTEPVDFDNLQQYLSSLHYIVENLPKFSHNSLNLQEIEGGSTSKYYFINPQGTIYSLPQPFQKDSTTTPAPSTIFREFPDLPLITDYLRNGTLLPPSRQVVEIL